MASMRSCIFCLYDCRSLTFVFPVSASLIQAWNISTKCRLVFSMVSSVNTSPLNENVFFIVSRPYQIAMQIYINAKKLPPMAISSNQFSKPNHWGIDCFIVFSFSFQLAQIRRSIYRHAKRIWGNAVLYRCENNIVIINRTQDITCWNAHFICRFPDLKFEIYDLAFNFISHFLVSLLLAWLPCANNSKSIYLGKLYSTHCGQYSICVCFFFCACFGNAAIVAD